MELDEKFLLEADREYVFNPIRPLIEEYKKTKEKEKLKQIQNHNYMGQRFRIFKSKEQLSEMNESENIEKVDNVDINKEEDILIQNQA